MSKSKTKRNFNIIDVDDDGDAGNVTRGDDVLEIGKFEEELDQVYDMLNRLTSVDASVSDVAKGDIDAYLEQRQRRQIEEEERKKLVAGCKVTSSKTLINNKEFILENRKKSADDIKETGNVEYRAGNYKRAAELYSSAILEYDQEPSYFTNRAQAYFQLKQFAKGVDDCREAIKLKPENIKSYVHLARSLKEMGHFGEAIEALDTAEKISQDHTNVIQKYKAEVAMAQKKDFLNGK